MRDQTETPPPTGWKVYLAHKLYPRFMSDQDVRRSFVCNDLQQILIGSMYD